MLCDIDVKSYALVLLDNVPPGTEAGIDYHAWLTGPHFRGIANVPPGLHFVFFAFADRYNERSPRSGFYLHLKPGDVVKKVYDAENELMKDVAESQPPTYNLEEIGKYLAPYPAEQCGKWYPLTDCISADLIARVQPANRKIDFLTTVPVEAAGKHMNNILKVDSRIENSTDKDTVIRFSKLPLKLPEGLTPQEISKHSMDSSFMLEELLKDLDGKDEELIGELQFAFVTFLIGQVYDCFEHWKLLVSLLTKSQDSVLTRHKLFLKFINTISLQMSEIPEDYFVDITAQHNFLVKTFQIFFDNFEDPAGISGELVRKVSLLKNQLAELFQVSFEEEDEEDLPVIVEL